MTYEEIIQALRCCASGESEEECPFTEKYGCDGCPKVSADLIERLTDENAALLGYVKLFAGCDMCRHSNYCKTDCPCDECEQDVKGNCYCKDCERGSIWEWRGLPDAPEEGDKHGTMHNKA